MKIESLGESLIVDPNISLRALLAKFRRVCPEMRAVPMRRGGDPYKLDIRMVSVGMPIDLYQGLELVIHLGGMRFLSLFEFLSLNFELPGLQMQTPLVIPRFIMWPTPEEMYMMPWRYNHGNVISFAERFDGRPLHREARFVMAVSTDVDLGTLDESLSRLDPQLNNEPARLTA
jgi:hypothetical protein